MIPEAHVTGGTPSSDRSRAGGSAWRLAPTIVHHLSIATAPRSSCLRHAGAMRAAMLLVAGLCVSAPGCGDSATPSSLSPSPLPTTVTLRVAFLGSTARRADLSPAAQPCVAGVGATHIHPSWRNFAGIPLQANPPDRYEIVLADVPVNTQVSFRINDQNSCDNNLTGAVTANVFANDVPLVQNTTTPGNGAEPGYALTIAFNGSVTQ